MEGTATLKRRRFPRADQSELPVIGWLILPPERVSLPEGSSVPASLRARYLTASKIVSARLDASLGWFSYKFFFTLVQIRF
jgi:hypothetical protein